MNDARIKAVRDQRYSEVSERQHKRNQERVDCAGDLLSELKERIDEDEDERLQTAKELISVAGMETRTKGCNIALTDCLKLLREVAEQSGHSEVYRTCMQRMPSETVSESSSAEEHLFSEREEDRRRREPIRTESDYNEHSENRGN